MALCMLGKSSATGLGPSSADLVSLYITSNDVLRSELLSTKLFYFLELMINFKYKLLLLKQKSISAASK